jgi:hypothetical protein
MEQILCHLVGDYIFQTYNMAKWKVRSWWFATYHAITYTAVFALITRSVTALLVIFVTHAIIDRYSLAKYVMKFKGSSPNDTYTYEDGFEYPIYTGNMFLVYVVTDNTLHLIINYLALRFL